MDFIYFVMSGQETAVFGVPSNSSLHPRPLHHGLESRRFSMYKLEITIVKRRQFLIHLQLPYH